MQKMKKVCILAFILVSICMNDLAVLAAEKTDEVLLLNQLKVENNGGESLIQKESNKEAHFTYDTAGLEEGYYTSFLYVEAEQSLSDVLGFSFEISTENALYLNLNLLANETTLVMPDHTNVYMLPEGSTKILCQVVENGTVMVPAGFTGKVVVRKEDIVKESLVKKIQLVGVTLTQKEDVNVSGTISNLMLVKKKDSMHGLTDIEMKLEGASQIEIPAEGEFIFEYELNEQGEKGDSVTFDLVEAVDGVTMTEEGRLIVESAAKPQTLSIVVNQKEKVSLIYQVELTAPWYHQVEGVDSSLFAIPSVEEMVPYGPSLTGGWKVLKYAMLIVLIAGFFGYLAFYNWKIKDRSKKRK